jgi:dUTP pyrophosphatase
MKIRITRIDPRASLPAYQTEGAAGFDLALIEETAIPAKTAVLARTGLGFGTPDGHALMIFPRSSLFKKYGLTLANSVGVLDQDYAGPQDELLLHLYNTSDAPVTLKAGDRVAQGVFMPITRAEWEEAEADSANRGGFGSTG